MKAKVSWGEKEECERAGGCMPTTQTCDEKVTALGGAETEE